MKLDEILQAAGKHKARRRIGRGNGSGYGKTSGRGHRGYGQRSGSTKQYGFEGGQNPMLARIPKRGFNNADFRTEYQIVNVATLEERFDPETRVAAALRQAYARVHGCPLPLVGMKYVADSSIFIREAGVPALQYGAGLARAHADLEWVELRDVVDTAKVLLLTAVEYLGDAA